MKTLPMVQEELSTHLVREVEAAKAYASEQHSSATRRAYRSDFSIFHGWCTARDLASMPAKAATVATFLGSQADSGVKPSTLSRRVAAIRYAHALAGEETPTNAEVVKATMRGIRRSSGAAKDQKSPLTAERLLNVLEQTPDTLQGLRDRALLLLGFAAALRRSELVALHVEDLEETPDGLRVTVRKSKTDQEGEGHTIPVIRGARACPVRAIRAWLEAAGITEGPVFRRLYKSGRVSEKALTPHSVSTFIKTYAKRAGYDPTEFSGHSLRAGFLTSAAERGASIFKMMDISRHKSVDTLRGYVRRAEEFKDHAGAGLL